MRHRLVCFLLGHDRRLLLVDAMKSAKFAHLFSWAGCLTECRRCGRREDDLSPEARQHFRAAGNPHLKD